MAQERTQKVMSFKEIVQGRDATVRVTFDGLLHVVDLVMVMTGRDKNQANEVFVYKAFCFTNNNVGFCQ